MRKGEESYVNVMETMNDETVRQKTLYDIIQSGQTLELASVY